MSVLDILIAEYDKQVKQLSEQINNSAAKYSQKESDLKQHLANHNGMIGALAQMQKSLGDFKQKKDAENKALADKTNKENKESTYALESNDNQEKSQD